VNFFRCVRFFRLRMASPCASIVALCPILAFGCTEEAERSAAADSFFGVVWAAPGTG
jgi:hypothetical protein